jgi:cation diffusion facilitator family transporter
MAPLGTGEPRKLVLAAIAGNAAAAIVKGLAAAASGSVTLLAEAVHSVADTANQALLLLGIALAKRRRAGRYSLGRAGESYFWALIATLMLFFVGGCFAIWRGVNELVEPEQAAGSQLVPLLVLLLAISCQSAGSWVALREIQTTRGERPLKDALLGSNDPTIRIVLLQHTGGMLGSIVALIAVITTWLSGSAISDGVGAVVIGVLLCVIGLSLAHDTRSLLLGEGATLELRQKALELARATEGVDEVTRIESVELGLNAILLALEIRLRDEIVVEQAEQALAAIEARIRRELPEIKHVFVEPDTDWEPRSKRA